MTKRPSKVHTPSELIGALHLISGTAKRARKRLDALEKRHLARVRQIFKDRNIVGIGIAEKVTEKKRTGMLSLCFYVTKKRARSRFSSKKMIPPVVSIGGRSALFTDVHQIGIVRGQAGSLPNIQTTPIQSGYSVSHEGAFGAGTVGAIVKNGRKYYILGNSHVLALSGEASTGDEVIYPGRFDPGEEPVATLTEFAPLTNSQDFVNSADAAIAEIDSSHVGTIDFSIAGAIPPLDVIDPVRGMTIVACGRTSGTVESTIRDIHCRILIDIDGIGPIGFVDQVRCDNYSQAGNSGALVVDKASGKILGLHVGGSQGDSIFTPIGNVRGSLGLKFQFARFLISPPRTMRASGSFISPMPDRRRLAAGYIAGSFTCWG